jgi:Ca-activated chloride channel homolog
LQVATDSASKAAVIALAAGSNSQQATDVAISYAGKNQVCGNTLTIAASNVVLGKVTYTQNAPWAFVPNGTPTTAAQVTARVTTPLFFAGVLGAKTFSPRNTSTSAIVRNKWCLVFDKSGSMTWDLTGYDWHYPVLGQKSSGYYPPSVYTPDASDSRLAKVRTGGNAFLDALTSSPGGPLQNQVALVTFSNYSSNDATFSTDYSTVRSKLDYYINTDIWDDDIANGGTNMSDGIQAAIDMFSSTDDGTPWNKIIIVFSDGQWNSGSDPLNGGWHSPSVVSKAISNNITIYTVGLLSQANNSTMTGLASQTGGKFYYATDGPTLEAAFRALAQTIPVILTQ